jgi:very-short-patch-repair endonuclease
MKKSKNTYNTLSDKEKTNLLNELYVQNKKSFADIASMYGTYANKIRRDAQKFNISIRDKSEAQKNALQTGKHKHPTKGQKRDENTKNKIGVGVMNSWENLSEQQLEQRKQKAKEQWEQLDYDTKINMQELAVKAVRETSKKGSKLEKFIHQSLLDNGYKVEFHKEQSLVTTKLQIDIFLPSMNTAIEIDGPSHFEPVWGQDALNRNISYDQKKEGLIIGKGLHLIRIKQTKDFSVTRSRIIVQKLLQLLNNDCKNNNVPQTLTIED